MEIYFKYSRAYFNFRIIVIVTCVYFNVTVRDYFLFYNGVNITIFVNCIDYFYNCYCYIFSFVFNIHYYFKIIAIIFKNINFKLNWS